MYLLKQMHIVMICVCFSYLLVIIWFYVWIFLLCGHHVLFLCSGLLVLWVLLCYCQFVFVTLVSEQISISLCLSWSVTVSPVFPVPPLLHPLSVPQGFPSQPVCPLPLPHLQSAQVFPLPQLLVYIQSVLLHISSEHRWYQCHKFVLSSVFLVTLQLLFFLHRQCFDLAFFVCVCFL